MENGILGIGLTSNIYLTDVLDVFIIVILTYIAILFLRQTRSLIAFLGIGVLGIIYILARFLHLYITALVLQSFFSIFIIVIVIVFQDELKRSFELIITSSTRKIENKSIISYSSTIFSIVQSVSNLMRKKQGALIVVLGKELIERQTRGGNPLNGVVTSTIIESIFNPKAPGHDGAVIVNKNRITKFGVHLPLSQNIRQIKERGTRHSAGLGISERTDALVIIVSEERGEVSVAKNGKIKPIKDTAELEKYITSHYTQTFPENPRNFLKGFFKKRLAEKIISILIGCLAWFFIVFQAEIVQRDFTVPISYINIHEERIITETVPETVTVTLSARGQGALSTIPSESITITVSGSNLKPGENEIEIEKNLLKHPFNVSLVNISPPIITVVVEEYTVQEIPIEVDIIKENEIYEIKEISTNPSTIKVLIPKDEEPIEFLKTEEIDVQFIFQTTLIEKRVILPETYRLHKDSSRTIYITLVVEEKTENNLINIKEKNNNQ